MGKGRPAPHGSEVGPPFPGFHLLDGAGPRSGAAGRDKRQRLGCYFTVDLSSTGDPPSAYGLGLGYGRIPTVAQSQDRPPLTDPALRRSLNGVSATPSELLSWL